MLRKFDFKHYYLHLIARIRTKCFPGLLYSAKLYSLVCKLLVSYQGCVTYTMLSAAHIFLHFQSNTSRWK